MLVLSRKKGERIVMESGDRTITVHVNEIHAGYVSIAIDAPQDVTIRRAELPKAKRRKETNHGVSNL